MRAHNILLWTIALIIIFPVISALGQDKIDSAVKDNQLSYSVGVSVIRNMKQQGIDIDLETLIKGMRDEYEGKTISISDEQIRASMLALQNKVRQNQMKNRRLAAEENKKAGEAFLSGNKTREGVVTLPSGLQYKIIKATEGRKPVETDTVECQYKGMFINGTEFDNSARAGKPVSIKVADLIPGWKEAIKLMPVGSKWQIFIPSQLAYGLKGFGQDIGPNETLIFDLELLAIK